MHTAFVKVSDHETVTEILKRDYRAADVFNHYGIDFCLGGNIPLDIVCKGNAINLEALKKSLNEVSLIHSFSSARAYNEWSIDFLLDFIINAHHDYLKRTFPVVKKYITEFALVHRSKFPFLADLQSEFELLNKVMLPRLQEEEEFIFPYIRQIAHAYQNTEPYARLLVQTLRKPLDGMMLHNLEFTSHTFSEWRRFTNNYNTLSHECTSIWVLFKKLQELENDFLQHIYLENNILYPKTIAMEKELLLQSGI